MTVRQRLWLPLAVAIELHKSEDHARDQPVVVA
jgi:hypothetical protein